MKRIVIAFFIVGSIFTGCKCNERGKIDTLTTNNLNVIMSGLCVARHNDGHYPQMLSELEMFDERNRRTNEWRVQGLNVTRFVCPGTGTRPGSFSNVDEWTDFIYVGNNIDSRPDVPMIISPPENHDGQYGYVVMPIEGIIRLPSIQVRALINEPWLVATNETEDNLNAIKREISVNVPPKFRPYYPNVNKWTRPLPK